MDPDLKYWVLQITGIQHPASSIQHQVTSPQSPVISIQFISPVFTPVNPLAITAAVPDPPQFAMWRALSAI